MSTYFIGDVHGCLEALEELLQIIDFDKTKDKLIFVGDLINRGPDSLGVLRFVRSLGTSAEIVLGNHDVSLIAYAEGIYHGRGSNFPEIMEADEAHELVEWLRQQPLLIHDESLNIVVTHAGIPPRWTIEKAMKQARKAEKRLRSGKFHKFLKAAYKGEKEHWEKDFDKYDKFSYRLNGFTRLRYCDSNGEPDYNEKCPIGKQSKSSYPWFAIRESSGLDGNTRVIFGHWAALGLHESRNAICLDSGCVWGGAITAVTLNKGETKYYQNK